ncbi:MAG: hypothetical protein HQK49_00785 [Oligoflexia bacterium]|nr:hypothetical protein [Oligoflexia bacterium]
MKTIAFIGSDKNAGKTTSLNFVYQKLKREAKEVKEAKERNFIITSVGINGEEFDNYESSDLHKYLKPDITIYRGDYFVTATEHLEKLSGQYKIIHIFDGPRFSKILILGQMLVDCKLVLEGPNEKDELLEVKNYLNLNSKKGSLQHQHQFFLIDGSIDRQVLAHPKISDYFFFSLLLSNRPEQINKANNLLVPIGLVSCDHCIADYIRNILNNDKNGNNTKSLLLKIEYEQGKSNSISTIYRGTKIAFLDDELIKHCIKYSDTDSNSNLYLYLNSALTKSLNNILVPFKHLKIILDNFTIYQDVSACKTSLLSDVLDLAKDLVKDKDHKILLLNQINVSALFMREEVDMDTSIIHKYSGKKPVINIFRENLNEIRVSKWFN